MNSIYITYIMLRYSRRKNNVNYITKGSLLLIIQATSLVQLQATTNNANITIPPQSVNVSLNEIAEFNCTAFANTFSWMGNNETVFTDNSKGIEISPVTAVDEAKGIRMSKLRIPVSSIDNATNITCSAVTLTPLTRDESEPALLLVQGLLESVSNLTVTHVNSTTILIMWNPPFTLEGVPILSYEVTVGVSEAIIVNGDINMLYHSIEHSSNSYIIINVVPINRGGEGNCSKFNISHLPTLIKSSSSNIFQMSVFTVESSTPATVSLMKLLPFTVQVSTATVLLVHNTTFTSTLLPNTVTPKSSDDDTIPVVVLALIVVIILAMMIILILIIVSIICCCHHRKQTIIIKETVPPQDDIIPAVSENPAYKLVTMINFREGNKKTQKTVPDYEEIEEIYFKHNIKDSNIEGDYELVECRD